MTYAPIWKRCLAFFIDILILLILNILLFLLLRIFGIIMQPGQENPIISIFLLLFNWFYFAFSESSCWQATFGKKILKIQVVDVNQQQINFMKATQRFVLSFLTIFTFFIGFFIALGNQKKLAIHDKFSGTFVVMK